MKVNTALCFIWAGISLLLQTGKRQDARTMKIASLCAVAITITAFLTLCQYVFGWNLGIDELLFADRNSLATLAPGRMGINTAVNFCWLGTALWLMNRSSTSAIDSIAIAQGLTIGTIAIAIQAIVGYAYNVRVLYKISMLTTSMALHTAICFAILGGGILVLTGDRGLMRVVTSNLIGSKVARRLLPTAIGLPLVMGWLILLGLGANWYDPNFALSLMAMSMAAIWVGLIRQNAAKLNRVDDDRIRSVDRMRSSEERLRLALLGAKQGIWELDVRTQALTWDDRCQELLGLRPDALVTYSGHFEAIHPEDRQRVAAAMELAMCERGEFALEYRTIYPDGTIHWVLAQGSYYSSATSDRMLGTMMDITVRKHAQLNDRFLAQLTRRLRQLTDPDEMQWETAQSLGEYLGVDRVTWCKVDWQQRLTTIDRDWYRDGLDSQAGVYALGDFLPPELQVALFAGESVVIADVSATPLIAPYLDTYQQLGMGAIAKAPCIFEERWVMTLNASTHQVRVWRDDEIDLMETIVAQIWPLVEQTRSDRALSVAAAQTRADRVIIEQQLGEIESIYRSAPIGLCFVDTDLRYVRINERLAQINGASVEAHIGHTLRELLPDLADDVEPIYRQVIETGEPIIELEISGMNPAQPGILRCWLASFYPQIDAEHRVVGVNAVVQEITERQREAALLQESQQKFRAIFDQTFELLGIVSKDGVLLDVNQAALDSIAAQKSALVGKWFWDTPWWHTAQLQQQLRAAIVTAASGQFIRYEVEFPHPNGGVSITDFSLKPVFDAESRVTMLVAEARDITDR